MSISIIVFVPWFRRVPDAERWMAAAASHGVSLRVSDFDPHSHGGGLPVTCEAVDASFEYHHDFILSYLADVDSYTWPKRLSLLRFGSIVEFVTHFRAEDRYAAVMASAILTVTVNGYMRDCATGDEVGARNVMEWARTAAQPPHPASLRERGITREAVHSHTVRILEGFGYARLPPPKGAQAGDLWVSRPGNAFRNELVEVSVYADGDECFMCVSYFGTPFDVAKLQAEGVSGNAGGWDLHQFLTRTLDVPSRNVLPQNIPVGPDFATSDTATQLERELQQADLRVFRDLRGELERQRVDGCRRISDYGTTEPSNKSLQPTRFARG